MNTLVALALAGGALVALDVATPFRPPIVLNLDQLLGKPDTLGDGKFQIGTELEYCKSQSALAEQLKAMSPTEAFALCTGNPADIRCRAVKELELCKRDITRPIIAPTVAEFTKGAKDAVDAIGDAIGAAIRSVFGDFAWVLVAGGVAYLVLLR